MSYVGVINLIVISLFALAAWLAIWARRDTFGRHATMLVFLAGVPIASVVSVETLGWSKPLWAAHELRGTYKVIGVKIVVDEAIYAYVDLPSSSEPRSIRVPYSAQTASKLQGMMDNPETKDKVMLHFDWTQDKTDVKFHEAPPEKQMPDKPPQEEPLRFVPQS